jgi:hypothetical protein
MNIKPPLKIEELSESFVAVDAEGKHLAFFYFAEEDRRHFFKPPRPTKDEALAAAELLVKASEPSMIPLLNMKP